MRELDARETLVVSAAFAAAVALPPRRMGEPAQRVVESRANIAVPAAGRDEGAGGVAIVVARVARMIALATPALRG